MAVGSKLDYRWLFYYAFRDWLYFEYERLSTWRPIISNLATESEITQFLRDAREGKDPEFLAVAETACAADVEAFIDYARTVIVMGRPADTPHNQVDATLWNKFAAEAHTLLSELEGQ